MINLKSNKGITLMVLMITIIVVLIIAGITITLSIDSIDQTIESQDTSEMLIVQHAMQERWQQYLEAGETEGNDESMLVGTPYYDDDLAEEMPGLRAINMTNNMGNGSKRIISSKHEVQISEATNGGDTLFKVEKKEEQLFILKKRGNEYRKEIVMPLNSKVEKTFNVNINNLEDLINYINSDPKNPKKISYSSMDRWNTKGDSVLRPLTPNTEDEEQVQSGRLTINTEIKTLCTITFNDFGLLGITGDGVKNSEFKVNYQTGYVEKIGSKASPLKGYTNDTIGNTTSKEVSITN